MPTSSSYNSVKCKIYELLRNEIGRTWRDLGRYLKLHESELDEIDEKYPKDLKSKITETLRLGENKFNGNDFIPFLCTILSDIRRNDLRRKIEKMQ